MPFRALLLGAVDLGRNSMIYSIHWLRQHYIDISLWCPAGQGRQEGCAAARADALPGALGSVQGQGPGAAREVVHHRPVLAVRAHDQGPAAGALSVVGCPVPVSFGSVTALQCQAAVREQGCKELVVSDELSGNDIGLGLRQARSSTHNKSSRKCSLMSPAFEL